MIFSRILLIIIDLWIEIREELRFKEFDPDFDQMNKIENCWSDCRCQAFLFKIASQLHKKISEFEILFIFNEDYPH